MNLRYRISIPILAGVGFAILASQIGQYLTANYSFRKLAETNNRRIEQTLTERAEAIQKAVDFGISESLAKGDMDVFEKTAKLQKDLKGLEELSLYSERGVVTYSSDITRLKQSLDAAVKSVVLRDPNRFVRETPESIEIYQPKRITKSCIECHTEWKDKDGAICSVMGYRFSKTALLQAQAANQAETAACAGRSLHLAETTLILAFILVVTLVYWTTGIVIRRLASVTTELDASSQQVSEGAVQVSRASQTQAQSGSNAIGGCVKFGVAMITASTSSRDTT